ncbi:MAG: GTPase ObgE [Actinobacteria bacterium]|nr:GTPase ObgE [Actinomycetota bacterium]
MFIDRAKIYIKGGDGGNGCVSFRHLKYKAKAGIDGGDGGFGGDIVFKVDEGLRTLIDFHYKRHYRAKKGAHGEGDNKNGRNGEDLILLVPPGTVIKDEDNNIIYDLTESGEEVVIAKGGRGGRGNTKFVTSTRRAPSLAEKGEPSEEKWIILELKLLADVGIIGYPNVGKSTLISHISAAKPKIADYPFTTLVPNLGVVSLPDGRSFIAADVPGLIEGAHLGKGLGQDFLRHIDRTCILIHLIDLSSSEGRDPLNDFKIINDELKFYDPKLIERPQIVAGNKIDLPSARENIREVEKYFSEKGYQFFPISAVTGEGIDKLVYKVAETLDGIKPKEKTEPEKKSTHKIISYAKEDESSFNIFKEDKFFVVKGKGIERMIAMTDFDNDEAVDYLQQRFDKLNLEKRLFEAGARDGDLIKIGEMIFDFQHPSSREKNSGS